MYPIKLWNGLYLHIMWCPSNKQKCCQLATSLTHAFPIYTLIFLHGKRFYPRGISMTTTHFIIIVWWNKLLLDGQQETQQLPQ